MCVKRTQTSLHTQANGQADLLRWCNEGCVCQRVWLNEYADTGVSDRRLKILGGLDAIRLFSPHNLCVQLILHTLINQSGPFYSRTNWKSKIWIIWDMYASAPSRSVAVRTNTNVYFELFWPSRIINISITISYDRGCIWIDSMHLCQSNKQAKQNRQKYQLNWTLLFLLCWMNLLVGDVVKTRTQILCC